MKTELESFVDGRLDEQVWRRMGGCDWFGVRDDLVIETDRYWMSAPSYVVQEERFFWQQASQGWSYEM